MTILGKILAILNVLAAAAFFYLALLDGQKRYEAGRAVYQHDLAAKGLPVDDKPADPGLPRERYLEKQPPDVTSGVIKETVGATGQPINAQVKELATLKSAFPGAVAQAATQAGSETGPYKELLAAKAGDLSKALDLAERGELWSKNAKADKVAEQLEKVLLLAPTGELRLKLINLIRKSSNRKDLLAKVAAREMMAQALLPLEERRPEGYRERLAAFLGDIGKQGDPQTPEEYLAKLQQDLAQMKRKGPDPSDPKKEIEITEDLSLNGRLDRLSREQPNQSEAERRREIAYLLFTLSQVLNPDGKPLDQPSSQRVAAVVGRKRFIDAIEIQTAATRQTLRRLTARLKTDLDEFAYEYNWEVKERFPSLQRAIKHAEEMQSDWEKQDKARTQQLNDRKVQHGKVLAQLAAEREKANATLRELADWQNKLFKAQQRGSGVLEENLRLEKQIRDLEKGR
jgi:hypothetical protein